MASLEGLRWPPALSLQQYCDRAIISPFHNSFLKQSDHFPCATVIYNVRQYPTAHIPPKAQSNSFLSQRCNQGLVWIPLDCAIYSFHNLGLGSKQHSFCPTFKIQLLQSTRCLLLAYTRLCVLKALANPSRTFFLQSTFHNPIVHELQSVNPERTTNIVTCAL